MCSILFTRTENYIHVRVVEILYIITKVNIIAITWGKL